jgi:predicted  nucleic acid-binding Zn-ribbon protein
VRARVDRDNATLDSGAATAKQLTDIQHELTSLARRQAELEDVELEIMERMEEAATALDEAQARMEQTRGAARQSATAWEQRSAEISEETAELDRLRADVVAELPTDLVALYEKVRERSGQGAGLLRHGRCGSCQLQLSSSDLDTIRSAASDEVARCQECGAILVRTEESGL